MEFYSNPLSLYLMPHYKYQKSVIQIFDHILQRNRQTNPVITKKNGIKIQNINNGWNLTIK